MKATTLKILTVLAFFASAISCTATAYTPLLEEEYVLCDEQESQATAPEEKAISSIIDALKDTKGTFKVKVGSENYFGRAIALFDKRKDELYVAIESRKRNRYCVIAPSEKKLLFTTNLMGPKKFLSLIKSNPSWRGYPLPAAHGPGAKIAGGILTGLGAVGTCAAGVGIPALVVGIVLLTAIKQSLYYSYEKVYQAAYSAVGSKSNKFATQEKKDPYDDDEDEE